MSDPKYTYQYPGQGYSQGYAYPQQPPSVVAPPQYSQVPPQPQPQPQRRRGFLQGCLAALCCCCLMEECCCDPTVICDW